MLGAFNAVRNAETVLTLEQAPSARTTTATRQAHEHQLVVLVNLNGKSDAFAVLVSPLSGGKLQLVLNTRSLVSYLSHGPKQVAVRRVLLFSDKEEGMLRVTMKRRYHAHQTQMPNTSYGGVQRPALPSTAAVPLSSNPYAALADLDGFVIFHFFSRFKFLVIDMDVDDRTAERRAEEESRELKRKAPNERPDDDRAPPTLQLPSRPLSARPPLLPRDQWTRCCSQIRCFDNFFL